MSTTTFTYPQVIRIPRTPVVSLILGITILALIVGTLLVIVLAPTRDAYQAHLIPVAVPVPTSLTVGFQPSPSETPALSAGVANEPSIVPAPVPVPPSP
jgi:hypothetical protein